MAKMAEYIERQAAINKIRYRERTYGCVRNTYSNVIKNLPAADVAPVVHAKWKESNIPYEYYICSACGGANWYYDRNGAIVRSKYCPNCGAVMDGKEGAR